MDIKVIPKNGRLKGKTASKNMRVARRTTIPINGTIIIKGDTPSKKVKPFRFTIVSSTQQMKERNSAYQFFSLD